MSLCELAGWDLLELIVKMDFTIDLIPESWLKRTLWDVILILTPQCPRPVLTASFSPLPLGHASHSHPFSPLTVLTGVVSNTRRGVGYWPDNPFFRYEVSGRGKWEKQGNQGNYEHHRSALLWTAGSQLPRGV